MGQSRDRQLLLGFPITGALSRNRAFPADPPRRHQFSRLIPNGALRRRDSQIAQIKIRRPYLRHPGSRLSNKPRMDGYTTRCQSYREAPRPSGRESALTRPFGSPFPRCDKVGACDDLPHPRAIAPCAAPTPVELASRGRVVSICEYFAREGADCAFFKAGRTSTYGSLQVRESETRPPSLNYLTQKAGVGTLSSVGPYSSDRLRSRAAIILHRERSRISRPSSSAYRLCGFSTISGPMRRAVWRPTP